MKKVLKYPLNRPGMVTVLDLSEGDEVLTVQFQYGLPTLWVLSDNNPMKRKRDFTLVGTGWSMLDNGHSQYISTIQEDEGRLVWHAFEITHA